MQREADRAGTPAAIRLSEYVAQRTSRRVFLRRTLTAAFAFSTTAAMSNLTGTAYADAVCGPQRVSPYCAGGQCSSSRQDCSSGAGCRRRKYATNTCGSWSDNNCWVNRYQDTRWLCCDCCCPGGSGSRCSGCSTKRACVCRFRIN
jgi:hypothetical protein